MIAQKVIRLDTIEHFTEDFTKFGSDLVSIFPLIKANIKEELVIATLDYKVIPTDAKEDE